MLYLESYSTVYGYVRARMAGDDAAEDVVAEAYMRAARSFASFDPSRAQFSTWVTTIAKNCMASHYRRIRPAVTLEDIPQVACAVEGGQDAVEDRELVKQLLACLDDDERAVVACKYRDDMRNVDIAKELGMNPSTVSTKLARALDKMHKVAERSM